MRLTCRDAMLIIMSKQRPASAFLEGPYRPRRRLQPASHFRTGVVVTSLLLSVAGLTAALAHLLS